MDHIANIEQITFALKANLDALDMLGFATAAAYLDAAIDSIHIKKLKMADAGDIPRFMDLGTFRSIDFSEQDNLIAIMFAK